MALFKLESSAPFPKSRITIKQRDVNIASLLERKGVFRPYESLESWESFACREAKALQQIERIIFGKFVSKKAHFDFGEMPPEYDDYQWCKHSEFQQCGGSITFHLSFGFGESGVLKQNQMYSTTRCFEKDLIWSLFSVNEILNDMILDARGYISDQAACNRITCDFWMSRTGMKGRTKLIESARIGEIFEVKPCEEFPRPGEYDVCLSDGRIIGAISWTSDFQQEEYERVYKKLDIDGYLKIVGVALKEVIPHGSPKGRPRKALARIEISYECIKPIKPYQVPASYLQKCANAMRVLAKIDYNRKIEIIAGERPDRYSKFSEIFKGKGPLHEDHDQREFLTRQPLENFKLDEISLDPLELEEFWDIFCSAYHCYKMNSRQYDNENEACCGLKCGQFLHHSLCSLSFEIDAEKASTSQGMHFVRPYLTLYRNQPVDKTKTKPHKPVPRVFNF